MSWQEGRVIENNCWTERHHSLKIETAAIPFQAGQFTRLALDIEGERIARPYSFVNTPDEQFLEFYFNTVPNGVFSNHLSTLTAGDKLWVASRAAGFLILSEVPEAEHLWLLATGTAIGPFISILKTDAPWERFSRITLVYGVRTMAELAYQQDIQHFKQRGGEQFMMVPSVTREHLNGGINTRIPQAVESGELEKHVGLSFNPSQSQVMLCGGKSMIRGTRNALIAKGLKKHRRHDPGQIISEDYG